MTVALDIKNVSHNFGDFTALDNVSLKINSGDFTVLLGLNGAGKTTLYSLITRLYNNNSGSIHIYGFNVRENSTNALKNIGVVFQQPTLDLDLSVKENLQYHSALHGISSSEANKRIENEIGRIKLEDKIKSKVRSLSGGQRRRVEIARSLLHKPKLLLLDEPTAGMARADTNNTIDLLQQIKEDRDITISIIEHDMHVVFSLADRITVLAQGTPLVEDVPEKIKGHPKVKEAYLGESQ